jgi:two-component system invasion response regulator UvrY
LAIRNGPSRTADFPRARCKRRRAATALARRRPSTFCHRHLTVTVRILLVDGHLPFGNSLRRLLDRQADWTVVGHFSDAAAAAESLRHTVPDVLVLNLQWPGRSGLATARLFLGLQPALRILMLSAHNDPPLVAAFLDCGGSGYACKGDPAGDWLEAISAIAAGQSGFSRSVAEALRLSAAQSQTNSD